MLTENIIVSNIATVHHLYINKTEWQSETHLGHFLAYHESGSNEHIVGKDILHIKTGTVLFLNQQIPYAVRNNDARAIVICFNCAEPIDTYDFVIDTDNNLNIRNHFNRMEYLWNFKGDAFLYDCMALLYEIFKELILLSRPKIKKSSAETLADSVAAYIRLHYSENNLQVSAIARLLQVSQQYLIRSFNSQYNISPRAYICKTRLNAARELLAYSDYRVSDIAELTGFNDAFYFSKAFRNEFGMPPSEYAGKREPPTFKKLP